MRSGLGMGMRGRCVPAPAGAVFAHRSQDAMIGSRPLLDARRKGADHLVGLGAVCHLTSVICHLTSGRCLGLVIIACGSHPTPFRTRP